MSHRCSSRFIDQDDPLVHMPGDSYLYSSYAYNLVSAIIEPVMTAHPTESIRRTLLEKEQMILRSTEIVYPGVITAKPWCTLSYWFFTWLTKINSSVL